jgi:molybdopterin converting factor small subunit
MAQVAPPSKLIYYFLMAKLVGKQIEDLARSIIAGEPGGIRYATLVQRICQKEPETSEMAVQNAVWNLHNKFPNEVSKPSRGLFTPTAKFDNEAVNVEDVEQVAPTGMKFKESDFYEPFAKWLKNDLDEVTEVAPLGVSFSNQNGVRRM